MPSAVTGAALFAAAVFCLSGGAAVAACQGKLVSGTAISSDTAYDPFAQAGVTDKRTIGVMNTGTQSCVYLLAFSSSASTVKLGGTLAYSLTNSNGVSILTTGAGQQPSGVLSPAININGRHEIPFNVSIDAGQAAAPGRYADPLSVTAQLYGVESGHYTLLDSAPLAVSYTVKESMTVNIAGAGVEATVDFHELTESARRSVVIQARSNLKYKLNVTSDNRGALVLTPAVPGREWKIPYIVTLDGQPLNLAATAATPVIPAAPIQGRNHALAVTIGDVSKKRAGLYKDIVTIEIDAAMP